MRTDCGSLELDKLDWEILNQGALLKTKGRLSRCSVSTRKNELLKTGKYVLRRLVRA